MKLDKDIKYCMKCKKENDFNVTTCECGSNTFVDGEGFSIKDNKIVCDCGCDDFVLKLNVNYTKSRCKTYLCDKCKNKIYVEYFRELDY